LQLVQRGEGSHARQVGTAWAVVRLLDGDGVFATLDCGRALRERLWGVVLRGVGRVCRVRDEDPLVADVSSRSASVNSHLEVLRLDHEEQVEELA
jgi:hypothetical protein